MDLQEVHYYMNSVFFGSSSLAKSLNFSTMAQKNGPFVSIQSNAIARCYELRMMKREINTQQRKSASSRVCVCFFFIPFRRRMLYIHNTYIMYIMYMLCHCAQLCTRSKAWRLEFDYWVLNFMRPKSNHNIYVQCMADLWMHRELPESKYFYWSFMCVFASLALNFIFFYSLVCGLWDRIGLQGQVEISAIIYDIY